MRTKSILIAAGGLLMLIAKAVIAQSTNVSTNALPLDQTLKYQVAMEVDRALGERALLPPGLKEKMQLTDAQRADLKTFEDDFAKTSQEYQTANQSRIDAAQELNRQARVAKSADQIMAARKQLQNVWAGLQPDRAAAVKQIRPLLTPDQVVILDDPRNQWRENHGSEANDPSSKN